MRIGFLSDSYNDPERIGSWSGLPFYFARNMRECGCEIVPIRGRDVLDSLPEKLRFVAWRLAGKRYLRGLNHAGLRAYARSAEALLASARVDAVFTVNTWLLAYLQTDLPVAFWSDATFASMLGFYESFSNLAPVSVTAGHEIERRALQHSTLAVYASHWAAQSAATAYRLDSSRILIAPFGANLDPMPTPEQVRARIDAKTSEAGRAVCELSCIGVDWKRKGVDLAVAATVSLHERGIPVRLRIAGCQPPAGAALPPYVELTGFIDKNSAAGQRQLQELYLSSHFFLLPSRAEAFGVVLSEAAVCGVPSAATESGGLIDVVVPGTNGQLFALEAPAYAYADWIASTWADVPRYRQLALSALDDYHARLCGKRASATVVDRLRAQVDARATRPAPLPQSALQPVAV